MVSKGVLCLDVWRVKAMKGRIIDKFMKNNDYDYLKFGKIIPSTFENVINNNVLNIPLHSHINLRKYFCSGIIEELDDEEYLYQSLVLMKS